MRLSGGIIRSKGLKPFTALFAGRLPPESRQLVIVLKSEQTQALDVRLRTFTAVEKKQRLPVWPIIG